jgi:hypothetical protein
MSNAQRSEDEILIHYNGRTFLLDGEDWRPGPAPADLEEATFNAMVGGLKIGRIGPQSRPNATGAVCILVDMAASRDRPASDTVAGEVVVLRVAPGGYVTFDPRVGQLRDLPAPLLEHVNAAFAGGSVVSAVPEVLGTAVGYACWLIDVAALGAGDGGAVSLVLHCNGEYYALGAPDWLPRKAPAALAHRASAAVAAGIHIGQLQPEASLGFGTTCTLVDIPVAGWSDPAAAGASPQGVPLGGRPGTFVAVQKASAATPELPEPVRAHIAVAIAGGAIVGRVPASLAAAHGCACSYVDLPALIRRAP